MGRPPLKIAVAKKDQQELRRLLKGGVQQVRVVLRALALLQLAEDASAPQIAKVIPLTPQAILRLGHRYEEAGLDGALYEKQRPGADEVLDTNQKQRIIAMVCSDPRRRARWTVRPVAEEAVRRKLVPRVGRETIRILLLHHDLKPWREKMWCVAELDEKYMVQMEDVLKCMKNRMIRSSLWCVWTRSPLRCTRMCVRHRLRRRGAKRGGITSTSAVARPMSSAP